MASYVHVCFVGVRLGRRGGSFLDRQVVSGLGLAGKVGSVLLWYVGMS